MVGHEKYWLYFHHDSLEDVCYMVDSAEKDFPGNFEIKVLVLMGEDNVFNIVDQKPPKGFDVEVKERKESILTVELSRETHYKGERINTSGLFNLIRYRGSNIYLIITHHPLEFVRKVLMKFLIYHYSSLSRVYISSHDIHEILKKVSDTTKGEIIVDRVVSYSRLDNKKFEEIETRRTRTRESDVRWTSEEFEKSFRRAFENDQWIDKITFSVIENNAEKFFGYISREGLFKCNRNLKAFCNIILNVVSNIGDSNIKLFKNRSRKVKEGKIRPLSIQYKSNIFSDVEQNTKLIKAISEFPSSTYSVYHGNPYLHLSLVDYLDGSSYDLWVLSEDNIVIVPQLKSSFSSIARLVDHISKRFAEGVVKEVGGL